MRGSRYPHLSIRNKTEFSRHIASRNFPRDQALKLTNRVLAQFSKFWRDSKHSEPLKGKYVRSAKGTPLGLLLAKINEKVLAPHDHMLPVFIFGGRAGTNHIDAARYLMGKKRDRSLIRLDVTRFFEQITEERVKNFFQHKCGCSAEGAALLAGLCCVPKGQKGSRQEKILARGFATSSRLAVWCTLEIFIELDREVRKKLRGHDARIAVYIDDIGIMASRVSKIEMTKIADEATDILNNFDPNQPLPLNHSKTQVLTNKEPMEHLGLRFYKSRVGIGAVTQAKLSSAKARMARATAPEQKASLKRQIKALKQYKKFAEAPTKGASEAA